MIFPKLPFRTESGLMMVNVRFAMAARIIKAGLGSWVLDLGESDAITRLLLWRAGLRPAGHAAVPAAPARPARPAALVGKASATSAACGEFSAAQALHKSTSSRMRPHPAL